MSIFTKQFWKASAERAINTFLQGALAAVIVGGVPTAFAQIDFAAVGQIGAIAAGISLIKSIIVNTATGDGPGLTNAETLTPPKKAPYTEEDVARHLL